MIIALFVILVKLVYRFAILVSSMHSHYKICKTDTKVFITELLKESQWKKQRSNTEMHQLG